MPTIPLDAQGLLDADVPCIACGYSLRSAKLDAACPECGEPVDRTVRPDLLAFADQAWLARVHFGLTMLLIVILVGMVLGMILGATTAALAANNTGDPLLTRALWVGFTLTIGLISLFAWFMLTAPEPDPATPEPPFNARVVTRVSVILGFATGLVSQGLLWLIEADHGSAAVQFIGVLAQAVGAVQIIAALVYARAIARRLPSLKLARHATILAWGLGGSQTAVLVVMLVSLALLGSTSPTAVTSPSTSTPPAGQIATTILIPLLGLIALILSIWMLLFANRLRMALRDVLRKTSATS